MTADPDRTHHQSPTLRCRRPGCAATIHARYRFCKPCLGEVDDALRRTLQDALVPLRRSKAHEPARSKRAWQAERLTRCIIASTWPATGDSNA